MIIFIVSGSAAVEKAKNEVFWLEQLSLLFEKKDFEDSSTQVVKPADSGASHGSVFQIMERQK